MRSILSCSLFTDYENPELAYKETFAYLKVQAIVAKFSSKGGEGMSMMLFQNNLIAISGVAVAIAKWRWKIELIKMGAYDDVGVSLMIHLRWKQQLKSTDRIHEIIINGGVMPNGISNIVHLRNS
ncbi:unnamed protein product [Rhizophagus irregularis]|nr:unnamed protein product [Rhizophagus irregularis]CAB4433746.1 unnamed protein product [Rhizophagus irregularis]